MVGKVLDLTDLTKPDGLSETIVNLYTNWDNQRDAWIQEQQEKRNYLFATDTSTTSNGSLPWKNKTTLPKLTQIRDNLHSNYMAALFPNDRWLRWEAHSVDAALIKKSNAIEAYMRNKIREGGFRETVSRLVYDYIDYGNAFSDVEYVDESKTDPITKETIPGYIGPKIIRVSPLDQVFNPTAPSYIQSPKITRTIMSLGELMLASEENPDDSSWSREILVDMESIRNAVGSFSDADFEKAEAFSMDGFGSLKEYYQSHYVELLECTGDLYDPESHILLKDYVITVADRSKVVRKQVNPSWLPKGSMYHVGWRLRPDNLYAMGPLDNLVGMQYRIDHLENLKADVMDLIAYPPLKIYGEVKEFNWGPNEEIHIDEGGDVLMLVPDTTALNADFQIQNLENKMEEFAGAPKQAMGIRTPGEKTAFEVQTLDNAAGRIFQEKITMFETELLEPALNAMLEIARRNLNGADLTRVMDDDIGVVDFISITKEDITASGKLRPIGARHFAAQAQLVQNLTNVMNSGIGQVIAPHVSGKKLAKLTEEVLNLERFELVQDNIGVLEQLETQRLAQQGQENLEVEAATPLESEDV